VPETCLKIVSVPLADPDAGKSFYVDLMGSLRRMPTKRHPARYQGGRRLKVEERDAGSRHRRRDPLT